MAIDAAKLAEQMAQAFLSVLQKKVSGITEYASSEAQKLAQTLVMIENLKASGAISEEQAKVYLQMQKSATRVVFLAIEGLGILAVEAAINAAMDVIKETVNTTLGFVLI